MARNIAVLVLLLFAVCHDKYTFGDLIEPTRYGIFHYLMNQEGYDPTLPPNFYTENATDVSVQLSIYDMNYESDLKMEYESTLYLRLNWTDPRLNFTANETSFETLKVSSSNIGKVWIPDLYFHHERHAELHGLMRSNQLVYIQSNGNVRFSGRINIKTHCKMDLKKYPYDKQVCPLVIQSYAFTAEDIILHWGVPSVQVSASNLDVDPNSCTSTFSSPYADPVGNFSTLNTYVTFTREASTSYQVMYIWPSVILFLVSLTSFLLGDDVTRVNIATGSLTPLMVQWAAIYSKLPPVSELSTLDRWMLANTIFVGTVVFVNVAMYGIRTYMKGKTGDTTREDGLEMKNVAKNRQNEQNSSSEGKSSKRCWLRIADVILFGVLFFVYIIFSKVKYDKWKKGLQ